MRAYSYSIVQDQGTVDLPGESSRIYKHVQTFDKSFDFPDSEYLSIVSLLSLKQD